MYLSQRDRIGPSSRRAFLYTNTIAYISSSVCLTSSSIIIIRSSSFYFSFFFLFLLILIIIICIIIIISIIRTVHTSSLSVLIRSADVWRIAALSSGTYCCLAE